MRIRLFAILVSIISLTYIHGLSQISHGGSPLPFTILRSASTSLYEEMPGFDLEEQLMSDSLEYSSLRASNRFAYKYITDFTPYNSGEQFILADGTSVWRLGVRSNNAYSINLLFSEFELPEGAQLFIYNPEQTQILGAFTHLNNSDNGILPISPIYGDALIIEYQEPAHAAFHAKLRVGEVNHDYRGLRYITEPSSDASSLSCIQPLSCSIADGDPYAETGRSVVNLIIDGMYYCTGTMVNNMNSDGTPYLLTASHCLNQQFKLTNPDYEKIAGKIIAFFNYNSPTCESPMRGTEEMSMVSLNYKAVFEDTDFALLEFNEIPPIHYRPYYSGWNATGKQQGPYICIQHPQGGTKRFSITDTVEQSDFSIQEHDFIKNAFWHVANWSTGCTAEGSSGSALFDGNNRIIGALTGGNSYCNKPINDYFYSLNAAWRPEDNEEHQLQCWLAPGTDAPATCEGLDPYAESPAVRLSNIMENNKQDSIETTLYDDGNYMFGFNHSETTEFAEEYDLDGSAIFYGCYVVTPALHWRSAPSIEFCVYSGSQKPEKLLSKQTFSPQITYFDNNTIKSDEKSLSRSQEHFLSFGDSIEVKGKLFISYRIAGEKKADFCVYNVKKGEITNNTTWKYSSGNWGKSSFNTALFIDPVIKYKGDPTGNEALPSLFPVNIFTDNYRKNLHVIVPEIQEPALFSLFNISGKLIVQEKLGQPTSVISTKQCSPGLYIANIKYKGKEHKQKLLFK